MSAIKDSDLLKIRQLGNNDANSLRQIAARIYDKKLKSFLALETKEEVLESCQQLLVTKTVDYMNVITQLQTGQLKTLNSLNDILSEKIATIGNLNSNLEQVKQINKQQDITIVFLNRDIEGLRKQIQQNKIKLMSQQEMHLVSIQESERNIGILKSEYYLTKSNLQTKNKELTLSLAQRTEELQNAISNYKNEIASMKLVRQKQNIEIKKKHKQTKQELTEIINQLEKDKKYLQDLIQIKDDQIKELKREKPKVNKKWLLERGGNIQLTVFAVEKVEVIQVTKAGLSKSKIIQKNKKMEEFRKSQKREKIQKKQVAVQVQKPADQTSTTPLIIKQVLQTSDVSIQTMIQDPTQNTENEIQIKLRKFIDEQYKMMYDQKLKQLNKKYVEEYKKALGQAKTLIFELTSITKQQIRLANIKFLEMELMYDQRPSRQQDLQYIMSLLSENSSLTSLCNQANQKTDSAYVALHQYHSKLESYKKLVPMNINGTLPPSIHSSRQNRDTSISRSGRSQSIKNNQNHYNSNPSWGLGLLSQPATSRKMNRNSKFQDQTFELTKDILVTDLDFSEIGSPLKRKNVLVKPQSGTILSLRKRSGIN